MRELKFRAWDTENKTWTFATLGDLICGVCKSDGDKPLSGAKQIWEQYTGLKDKNGKEIYEGDIVKARWYRAKNSRLDTKGEVKFSDGWFYIDDDPDGQDRLGVPVHNCYNIEVIGNIHENKELLK